VEFIPCSWISADNQSARWPGFVSRVKVLKAIQSEMRPDDAWKAFAVRIMAFAAKGSVHVYHSEYFKVFVLQTVQFLADRAMQRLAIVIRCRLSVCGLSSVTRVYCGQMVQIFGNISTALDTLAIR